MCIYIQGGVGYIQCRQLPLLSNRGDHFFFFPIKLLHQFKAIHIVNHAKISRRICRVRLVKVKIVDVVSAWVRVYRRWNEGECCDDKREEIITYVRTYDMQGQSIKAN